MESGRQTMRPEQWRAVLPVVALGDPAPDEMAPVNLLARFRDPKLGLVGRRDTVPLFADPDLALQVAALLSVFDPETVFALPIWVN